MLREQLEQVSQSNNQLNMEVQKLTADWNKAREELEQREEEEQKYFSEEHEKLIALWQTINGFRRLFNDLKIQTQKYVDKSPSSQFLCNCCLLAYCEVLFLKMLYCKLE